jgi:predicted secreted protein
LAWENTHSWYVKAVNGAGLTTQSTSTFSFTVHDATAPAAFNLTSPANGATIQENTPTLTWAASSDSGSGLDNYEVWLDSVNVAKVSATTTSYTTSVLSLGVHSWYIKAVDKGGNKTQSTSTFGFTVQPPTDTTPPTAFNLTSPANGGTTADNHPPLTWAASSDPQSGIANYEVWLDGVKVTSVAGTTTSYNTSNLAGGSHTWYIKAVNGAGLTTQSTSTFTFTVPGGASVLVGDVNGDGSVTIVDALLIAKYAAQMPVTINVSAADVDCSLTVTIVDALLVAKYAAQMITKLGC